MLGTCVRCVGLWMKEENFRSIFFLHQGPVVQKPINAKFRENLKENEEKGIKKKNLEVGPVVRKPINLIKD